jgi:hypothetical protein
MAKKSSGSTRKSSSTRGRSGGGAKSAKGRGAAKRQLINTGTDKRFVRRDAGGRIKESDDVGRSLASDRRKKAKTVSKAGQGDKGDRKR